MRETRRQGGIGLPLRRLGAGLGVVVLAAVLAIVPAAAQSPPEGYFDQVEDSGGEAQVEADMLAYDPDADLISAEGRAVMYHQGYKLSADRLTYHRGTGRMTAIGNVELVDPQGNRYVMDSIEVTGGMKQAFVRSLTLYGADGSLIMAADVNYDAELRSTLVEGSYAPCGTCIDAKGRKIGWKIHAAKIVHDRKGKMIYLDQPTIEVLGMPVAWLPWLAFPDPTQRGPEGFQMPRYFYDPKLGHGVEVPYFVAIGDDIDLLLRPQAMTRQGFLLGAEYEQRFDYGTVWIDAAGLYQMDRSAFAGTVGDVDWRGAATVSGEFVPLEDWKAGFSFTTFTDAAFLKDYYFSDSKNSVNEVYATYLVDDYYADIRVQKFNALGNVTWAEQEKQVRAIPNIKAASYTDLSEWGQVRLSARIMGIQRGADSSGTYGGVPYVFGYQENKVHGTLEASWQKQYVTPIGVVATPYLGLRGDYASYDGASPLAPAPVSLLSATPIAAMDIRFPLVATNGYDSHLLEPVVQLVYRGTSETLPGIFNDNAQSFVFDDTNLFSYDRFSGSDRQETGLRANIGARYMANFADGSWLELIGGQSYQLAGVNGLGVADHAQTGNSTGLGGTASYIVLGAQGSLWPGVKFGAKTQLDPNTFRVARAGVSGELEMEYYTLGVDYFYLPANAAVGTLTDQHQVTVRASAPLPMFDYWYVDGSYSWDIGQSNFLAATAGLKYDDGYFMARAFTSMTGPTHTSPNNLTFGVGVNFKTASGAGIGF